MTISVALTDRPGQEARVQGSALVRHGAALVRARAYHESWKVPRRRTSGSKALKKGVAEPRGDLLSLELGPARSPAMYQGGRPSLVNRGRPAGQPLASPMEDLHMRV